jgi:hypothetical protein
LQYTDTKRGIDVTSDVHAVTPITDGAVAVDWDEASATEIAPDALAQGRPALKHASACCLRRTECQEILGVVSRFRAVDVRAKPLRLFLGTCVQIELEAR